MIFSPHAIAVTALILLPLVAIAVGLIIERLFKQRKEKIR